jgi:hypothetical protein
MDWPQVDWNIELDTLCELALRLKSHNTFRRGGGGKCQRWTGILVASIINVNDGIEEPTHG